MRGCLAVLAVIVLAYLFCGGAALFAQEGSGDSTPELSQELQMLVAADAIEATISYADIVLVREVEQGVEVYLLFSPPNTETLEALNDSVRHVSGQPAGFGQIQCAG
jgi:hypothetical protein